MPDIAGNGNPTSLRGGDSDHLLARRLDGLIRMLSHDLRTPLSAISGWLFLLESGKLDSEGQKRAIGKIRSSVEEQVRLIDDTLAISRSETGGIEVDANPVALGDALAAAIAKVRGDAEAKGIALAGDVGPASVTVSGDAAALQRALELILAHAIAATPPEGRVTVSARASATWIDIAIADSGSGFAAEDLPWVLDPFGRPRDERRSGPRGAERGLLVAKALVSAQGGGLSVSSDGPGRGAALTIGLPLPRS